jgi:hypothetical protein
VLHGDQSGETRLCPRIDYFPLVFLLKGTNRKGPLKLIEGFFRILVPALDKTERSRHLAP